MIEIEIADVLMDALGGKPMGQPLNGDDVLYQYHTQHDARVRPSHAALDGTVWRADDPNAPTPPIAYGCRCFLTMVARPDSDAAKALPIAPKPPTTVAAAFAVHLDAEVPTWREIADKAMAAPLAERPEVVAAAIVAAHPGIPMVDARDLARMALIAVAVEPAQSPALVPVHG